MGQFIPQLFDAGGRTLGSSLSQTSSLTVGVRPLDRTHAHVTSLVWVPPQVAEQPENSPVVHLQTDKADYQSCGAKWYQGLSTILVPGGGSVVVAIVVHGSCVVAGGGCVVDSAADIVGFVAFVGGSVQSTPQLSVVCGLIAGSSLSQTSSLTLTVPPADRTHTHVTALVCVPSQVAEHTEYSPLLHLQTAKTD